MKGLSFGLFKKCNNFLRVIGAVHKDVTTFFRLFDPSLPCVLNFMTLLKKDVTPPLLLFLNLLIIKTLGLKIWKKIHIRNSAWNIKKWAKSIFFFGKDVLYGRLLCVLLAENNLTNFDPPKKIFHKPNWPALKVGSKMSICPGKSHTENCTNDEFVTSSLTILLVDSKNKVSVGDILWKTTL